MAYAEICACIRTLQEATFQQESEIFRLREREAHLKQLVADLTEKLHGSKDALIRNGNVSAGLDKSHSRDNRESSSQDSRASSGVTLLPPSIPVVVEIQSDSRQQSTALKTTPTLKRKEVATPTPSPKCDRKPPPIVSGDAVLGPPPHSSTTGQPAPSPGSIRRVRGGAVSAPSPRQPIKVTKSTPSPVQQQQRSSTPIEAMYDIITFSNMDSSMPPPDVSKGGGMVKKKKKLVTHTMSRGGSTMDDQSRRRTLLSSDMETNLQDRIVKTITLAYGGDMERVRRATLCIQRAYRAYTLRAHYRAILRQGPSVMRSRANTGMSESTKRLSIMGPRGGDRGGGRGGGGDGGVNQGRAGSNLTRVETMARLREKSNLYNKERPLTRRERIFRAAGSTQLITPAPISTSEARGDLTDSGAPISAVGRKRSGGVFAEGGGAGKQLHPLQRSHSTEVFGSTSSVKSSEGSSSNSQENTSVGTSQMQRSIGIHQFNRKPTTGIQYLVSAGLLEDSPLHVAKFLHEQAGLSKLRIGEFLGEIRMEFNMAVLGHMAGLIDMKNKPIDEALREFQKMFLMPGEAQKIDKIMQTFAAEYFKANTDIVENEDAAYILSFAIMMLHTSLHNPSVKHKTSIEQWITMNRGNNGGKDFPKQFLLDIYERIKKTPFATGQDHTTELMEIQQQLVGSPIHNLVNPQRCLVLKACVSELDCTHSHKRKSHKRTLLIFNDLVVAAKKKQRSICLQSFIPSIQHSSHTIQCRCCSE